MNISGTLHFYSGDDKELFFVFDDEVAQEMYRNEEFDIEDLETRRVYISVGSSRFIHQRTLSFSRKQTEIKVSLCSRNTKDELGSLTDLYNWFAARGTHPTPFGVLGRLAKVSRDNATVWELILTEPEDLITPPGLPRRQKTSSPERRMFERRREILQRDLAKPGRSAEELAFRILKREFPKPDYTCHWRQDFLDSEKAKIRELGIIADIDIWNVTADSPDRFIEVKAQKITGKRAKPIFHLSSAEWRSYQKAKSEGVPYAVWLFQYSNVEDLASAPQDVILTIFDEVSKEWLAPEGYIVAPTSAGRRRKLRKNEKLCQ